VMIAWPAMSAQDLYPHTPRRDQET